MEVFAVSEKKKSPAVRTVVSWMRDLALSVVIAFVVIIFIYQPVKVEGTSMMPGLVDQERIFVNKFIYRMGIGEIQRGDLIVFWPPSDPTKSYIKRVIGLPGDTVAVRHGQVFVNGMPLEEDYVPKEYRDGNFSMPPVKIAPSRYFVMGDHRDVSNDSRTWGPVPRNCIYGKAVFVYWPLDRAGPVR
jgi:signal peptidase I